MALVVNHNIPALQAYNAVNFTTSALEKSIQKLSTGLRINSAADDAAGLAISEKMRAQVRGLDRAVMNSQDGISMIQTAEGALNETHSILQRMRELSVQAANDTLTQQDRGYIQEEINQLREEITRIGNTTQFNKKKLLDGSAAALWSSSDLSTKAIVNGGLRTIDQFGQKSAAEGNYIININADPGKAQAQKSDIFTIKHKDVIMNVGTNEPAGVDSVYVNNIPAGDYQVTLGSLSEAEGYVDGMTKTVGAEVLNGIVSRAAHTISAASIQAGDAAAYFEITVDSAVKDANGRTTAVSLVVQAFNSAGAKMTGAGSVATVNYTGTEITTTLGGGATAMTISIAALDDFDKLADDMKIRYDVVPENSGIIQGRSVQMISSFSATSAAGSTALAASDVEYTIKDAQGNYVSVSFQLEVLDTANSGGGISQIGFNSIAGQLKDGRTFSIGSVSGPVYHANVSTAGDASVWVDVDNDGSGDFEIEIRGITSAHGGTIGAFATVAQATKNVTDVGTYMTVNPGTGGGTADLSLIVVGATVPSNGYSSTQTFVGGTFRIDEIKLTSAAQGYDVHVTFIPNAGGTWSGSYTLNINSAGAMAGTPVAAASAGSSISFGDYKFTVDFSKLLSETALTAGDLTNLKGLEFKIPPSGATKGTIDEISNTELSPQAPKATFVPADTDTFISADVTLHVVGVTGAAGSEELQYAMMRGSTVLDTGSLAFGANHTLDLGTAVGTMTLDLTAAKAKDFRAGDEFKYELRNGLIGQQQMVGLYGKKEIENVFHLDAKKADANASILFEVTAVNDMAGSVTFKATSNVLGKNGELSTRVADVTVNRDDLTQNVLGVTLTFNLTSIMASPGTDSGKMASTYFKVGDKMAYNVYAAATAEENNAKQPKATSKIINISGEQTVYKESWGSKDPDNRSAVTYEDRTLHYSVDADVVAGKEVHFKNFYINEDNGTYYTGDIVLGLNDQFAQKIQSAKEGDTLSSFTAAYVGQTAKSEVKLQDLNKFWNSEGVFMLKDSKTLTITQGDGKTASVTLYAQDTLKDVAMKLNKAIAEDLGQMSKLKIDNSTNFDEAARSFVTFVDDAEESTSEAVEGTFVVRSAIAGENGRISFAGDEGILNALSLGEIQKAQENSFTVSVWDAHNGNSVASSVKVTGNKLIGVVHENVDVEFDPMANIEVTWNDTTKSFMMKKEVAPYETTLHLADNSTVFQIGANEGEDMGINIGDMRAEALGLSGVLVTDKDSAGRSITIIDNALDKVSTQRAKLGAYQNRLEHTVNNLTVASQNLTAAESRIRDTDMAKEMMSFTKLQIMLQAGTSMLAQANGLPQNVLSLIR